MVLGQALDQLAQVPPPAAIQCRQDLRRGLGPIHGGGMAAAVVATVTGGRQLANGQQQGLLTAARPLGHGLHAS